MFVGWEGVGLASYLLIGFYFQKKSAADAGKKAFIGNRTGAFGFLIGMFLLSAGRAWAWHRTFSSVSTSRKSLLPTRARRPSSSIASATSVFSSACFYCWPTSARDRKSVV